METKGIDNENMSNVLDYLIKKYSSKFQTTHIYQNLEKIKRICFNDGINASEKDLKSSIRFLTKLLHEHFDKKVFVLIDEYDSPMNNLIGNPDSLKKVTNVIKEMFRDGLKNNEYLEKS